MTKKDKVTVEDIIGIVHTDETTNSVEEVRKLRGRENRTKKRFTYFKSKIGFGKQGIDDNLKGYTFDFTLDNVLDCMNDLSEENEQLKKDCTVLIYHNQEYRKENEQLKSTIKEVTELLSEEVDLFSDKATEHDINAYVELKELDNKDAYYMATATKKAIRMLKELQE